MAYADRSQGGSKVTSIIIVALIHAVLGYAFVTGLAFNVVKKVAADLKTFDVEEEPPPPEEEPPPPPPDQPMEPPPVVAPPAIVQTTAPAPMIQTVQTPPPVFIPTPKAAPPPPPPPAPTINKSASARGNPADWISTDDYPSRALREGKEGVSRISWDINTEGRVENCRVTSSSGTPELDEAACRAITRRGRYKPALDQNGRPIRSSQSRSVRWQIPND